MRINMYFTAIAMALIVVALYSIVTLVRNIDDKMSIMGALLINEARELQGE